MHSHCYHETRLHKEMGASPCPRGHGSVGQDCPLHEAAACICTPRTGPSSSPPPLAHWRWPAASISTSHHTRAPRTPASSCSASGSTGVCMANLSPAACTPQLPNPATLCPPRRNTLLLLPVATVSSTAETWPGGKKGGLARVCTCEGYMSRFGAQRSLDAAMSGFAAECFVLPWPRLARALVGVLLPVAAAREAGSQSRSSAAADPPGSAG